VFSFIVSLFFPLFLIFIHFFFYFHFSLSLNLSYRSVYKIISVFQRKKILKSLSILLLGSERFLGQKCFNSFLLLLLYGIDDEYVLIRRQSVQIWEKIRKKSIKSGNYPFLRSSLMSVFTDILGKNKTYQKLNSSNNNKEEEKTVTVNFSDFVNGNKENKLQEILKLFLGLGVALGKLV
jgi:hypothetical protein